MSHVCRPGMLKTLIEAGSRGSTREIAAAFLARDKSQPVRIAGAVMVGSFQ